MELRIFWEWGIDIAGGGSRLCGNFLQKTFWFFLLNKWWLFVVFVDSVSAPLGCLSSPKLMLRRNLLIFSFISSTSVASVWKRFAVFPFCVSFFVRKHHLSWHLFRWGIGIRKRLQFFFFHINILTVQTLGFTLECLLQIYTSCQELKQAAGSHKVPLSP